MLESYRKRRALNDIWCYCMWLHPVETSENYLFRAKRKFPHKNKFTFSFNNRVVSWSPISMN